MRFVWDAAKEQKNLRKHGFDFSLAERVFRDPLLLVAYDRYEEGEHRWRAFGRIGEFVLAAVVHAYPDPDDETLVRVIGLRVATAHERKRYEEGSFDGGA